jgi:hypothetical protein
MPPLEGYQTSLLLSLVTSFFLPTSFGSLSELFICSVLLVVFAFIFSGNFTFFFVKKGSSFHPYVLSFALATAFSFTFEDFSVKMKVVFPLLLVCYFQALLRSEGQSRSDFFSLSGLWIDPGLKCVTKNICKVYTASFAILLVCNVYFRTNLGIVLPYMNAFLLVFPGVLFVVSSLKAWNKDSQRSAPWEA